MKNVTPRQLAYLSALAVGVGMTLLLVAFNRLLGWQLSWRDFLFFLLFNLLWCFLVFYFALERFIYRKIKLIYKNIHSLKVAPDSPIVDKVDMNRHMIEEVEEQVRRWTEERRREIDQLKRMEAYRREYIGNVSHELRTPIFALQGYLETLLEGGLYDEAVNTKYLEKALQNADRLTDIIKDLEIITQHEAEALKLNKTRFRMYDLAREAADSMERLAVEQGIMIGFKEGSDRTLTVYANRHRIQQVLINLLTNAIKYGRENGRIWLAIYNMDTHALIEVTDNGIGIEERHLSRLFERFYRVDASRARIRGGSGLGLAIVKHLIEAHDQRIHVRSMVGLGTTFGFTLPIKEED